MVLIFGVPGITYRAVELAGMEDLGAGEKAESSELPHDVLTDTVRQAGVTLGVAGQREDVLQHPRQGVPAVLCQSGNIERARSYLSTRWGSFLRPRMILTGPPSRSASYL